MQGENISETETLYDKEVARRNISLLKQYLRRHLGEPNTLRQYIRILGQPDDLKTFRLSLLSYATLKLNKPFDQFTLDDFKGFLELKDRMALKSRGSPLKHNTKATIYRICTSFLKSVGVEIDVKSFRRMMPSWGVKPKVVYFVDLTEDEVQRIKACMPTLEGKLAVELQAHSGLRPAEALGVRWGDLFEATTRDGRSMLYARIVHRPGGYGAKGRYSERTVPLSMEARRLIEAVARQRRVRNPRDPAWRGERIVSLEYDEYRSMFRKAVREAGIPPKPHPVNPHILRHFFAIEYLRRGGSPSTLRSIMGIQMDTLQRYVEVAGRDVSTEYASLFGGS